MPAPRYRCARRLPGTEPRKMAARRLVAVALALGLSMAGALPVQAVQDTASQNSQANPFGKPLGGVRPLASGVVLDARPVQGGIVRGEVPAGVAGVTLDGKNVPIAEDGRFLIAFGRDAAPESLLEVTLADGTVQRETLAVDPRSWRIEHVSVARTARVPSEAFMAVRTPELDRIAAARALRSDSLGWRQRFIWPSKGRISGLFGAQRVYAGEPGSYHSGVDVAGGMGADVVAPADGVVVLAADQPFSLEGHLLMLDHGAGLGSAFLHLSAIVVKPGEAVRQGQLIGRIGASGRATGPHLHWGMTWNGERIDPLLVAGPMPTN